MKSNNTLRFLNEMLITAPTQKAGFLFQRQFCG
jgi:hypothetical protein